MDYNTQQKKLVLPEYGRNIQLMVDYVKNIEDIEERTRAAQAIINVMGNMNPHLRDINDFKHKLWDHLAIMSDFELDIQTPYPLPSIETLQSRPGRVPYSLRPPKYRFYGKIIEQLIRKAVELKQGEEKDALVKIIANHMKKSYIMWNKDNVDDDIIFETIRDLSQNKIELSEEMKLSDSKELMSRPKRKRTTRRNDTDQKQKDRRERRN